MAKQSMRAASRVEQGTNSTIRRQTADGILEAVALGGRIKLESLQKFVELYPKKAKFKFHLEIAVESSALLKVIDNEADLQEVLARLEAAPDLPIKEGHERQPG